MNIVLTFCVILRHNDAHTLGGQAFQRPWGSRPDVIYRRLRSLADDILLRLPGALDFDADGLYLAA